MPLAGGSRRAGSDLSAHPCRTRLIAEATTFRGGQRIGRRAPGDYRSNHSDRSLNRNGSRARGIARFHDCGRVYRSRTLRRTRGSARSSSLRAGLRRSDDRLDTRRRRCRGSNSGRRCLRFVFCRSRSQHDTLELDRCPTRAIRRSCSPHDAGHRACAVVRTARRRSAFGRYANSLHARARISVPRDIAGRTTSVRRITLD